MNKKIDSVIFYLLHEFLKTFRILAKERFVALNDTFKKVQRKYGKSDNLNTEEEKIV